MTRYIVHRLADATAPSLDWDSSPWRDVPSLSVDQFHARSTDHRPVTQAKLALAGDALLVLFRVHDRYVRSVATRDLDPVSRDSCVECFLQPDVNGGYFNFEFNCGGVRLAYHIEDPGTPERGLGRHAPLGADTLRRIEVRTTMPRVTPIEIQGPIEWRLCASIPLRTMGPVDAPRSGSRWRANLYKCGDRTSHPHWASWSPLGEGPLSFHRPERFGELEFA